MPKNDATGWVEPDIVINGRVLSFAECMVVRVAISSFRIGLSNKEMREALGEQLADGYDHHLLQVERIMFRLKD
jgi:hypothetical protein